MNKSELDWLYNFPSCFAAYNNNHQRYCLELLYLNYKEHHFDLNRYNTLYKYSQLHSKEWTKILKLYTCRPLWWRDVYKYGDLLLFMINNDILDIVDVSDIIYHYANQLDKTILKKLVYELMGTLNKHNICLPEVKAAITEIKKLKNKEFDFIYKLAI